MTNRFVLENKISSIQKYLTILTKYEPLSQDEIIDDVDIKGAVERYLYLVTQSTIDLAEAVIAYKGYRKPATFSEGFTILAENKIINQDLEKRLVKMSGFRNALAHGYEKINYEILHNALQNSLKDIEEFISLVKNIR
ncbi:MAG: hypothetical protein US96_C0039G0017 [Candidatus Woesebacteria bacterium GW2011_GWB1_38_5b]|uniref:DUF86 domain-containing protein n=1 Tax=Candidatus Woesebacteria bacterium GW2011_GWB1_38_5b TaxID=1618569 RepID=A0A0G0NAQ9_9BACT|nr:MAG: hypothetical protein US96_C0039G0017 [Candidatus Woesebacteria bacterium GW2011_GWB1_38_5b]